MRAAIYVRVSKGDQRTGLQLHAAQALVHGRGWTFGRKGEPPDELAFYTDTASGARRTRRPGLDAMMRDARSKRFDVIVVYKRDRLFRSLREQVLLVAELGELKIDIVSASEQHFDTTTPMGKAMLWVAAVFAELERDLIAERTKEGVADARRRGKRLGRPPRVDAAQVRAWKEQGLSFKEIAARLGLPKGGTVHRALQRALRDRD
jgi:DNA invertase Pin-like site-specific DNA recombinase